jgi:glucokinase
MLLGFDIGGTKCAVILGSLSAEKKMIISDKVSLATDLPVFEMIELLFVTAEKML